MLVGLLFWAEFASQLCLCLDGKREAIEGPCLEDWAYSCSLNFFLNNENCVHFKFLRWIQVCDNDINLILLFILIFLLNPSLPKGHTSFAAHSDWCYTKYIFNTCSLPPPPQSMCLYFSPSFKQTKQQARTKQNSFWESHFSPCICHPFSCAPKASFPISADSFNASMVKRQGRLSQEILSLKG